MTVSPAAGLPITPPGAVLSTIFEGSVVRVTLAGVEPSVTTKRRSYSPSSTPVVFQTALYGAVVSVVIVVQSSSPAGEYWKATEAIPEGADGLAFSDTVPLRYAPGSLGWLPGGLASIRTSVECTASTFPATSVEK